MNTIDRINPHELAVWFHENTYQLVYIVSSGHHSLHIREYSGNSACVRRVLGCILRNLGF